MNITIKRIQKIPVIDETSIKRFIKESNERRMTTEELEKCKDSSKLFKRNFKM